MTGRRIAGLRGQEHPTVADPHRDERRHVDLSLLESPIAAGVAVSYYTLFLAGEMLTRVSPGFMVQRFRIRRRRGRPEGLRY